MASTSDLIIVALQRLQPQVPALAKLKIVVGLELTAGGLTSPGESEQFRVEMPGPQVSDGFPEDARLQLQMPRAMFGILAEEGELMDWKEAFYYGHLKVEGDARVKRLLGQAIEKSDATTSKRAG
jgi:hypothetical protein